MKNTVCLSVALFLISQLCCANSPPAKESTLSQADLEHEYVGAIVPAVGGLTLQFKSNGARCQIIRNGKPTGISEYNQRIVVTPSENLELAFKNATLSFRRLTGGFANQGFLVEATRGMPTANNTVPKRAAIAILAQKRSGGPELQFFAKDSTLAEIKTALKNNGLSPITISQEKPAQ